MLFQDRSLLGLSRKAMKGSSDRGLEARVKEANFPRGLDLGGVVRERI